VHFDLSPIFYVQRSTLWEVSDRGRSVRANFIAFEGQRQIGHPRIRLSIAPAALNGGGIDRLAKTGAPAPRRASGRRYAHPRGRSALRMLQSAMVQV